MRRIKNLLKKKPVTNKTVLSWQDVKPLTYGTGVFIGPRKDELNPKPSK